MHFLYPIGEPCVQISSALNGQIQCTGSQVTDENCTFTCDPGYDLTGSNLRTCQANHTWSGDTTICSPLHCSELNVPTNSSLMLPCKSEYTSNCTLLCEDGFYVDGNPGVMTWIETCDLANETVEWKNEKKCIGKFHKQAVQFKTQYICITS